MNDATIDLSALATQINAAHVASAAATISSLEHARDCGKLLIEARAAVKHGQWLAWLKANVACSVRTAQYYMKVAEHWEALADENATVANLTLKTAVKLLTLPKPREYMSVEEYMSERQQALLLFCKSILETDRKWKTRHERLKQFDAEAKKLMDDADAVKQKALRAQAKAKRMREQMESELKAEFERHQQGKSSAA